MEELSLHILDIVENSVVAQADKIEIKIVEDLKKDTLLIEISDNGTGMDEEMKKQALDPFYTTKKTRRFGLGLPLLSEAAKAANGNLLMTSKKEKGTKIKAKFKHSHVDRQPLGDMSQTLITLVMGNPDIEFIYNHKKDSNEFYLDTRKIRAQLNGIPINSPHGMRMLRENLNEMRMKLSGGKHER